ncbi:Eco57I restriction-modification methylase domain-containing protein [Janthinobacterium sp. UMAB-60]|uniref:Eco57I restriction-modification methylase domain-containing protein n=1 Tax=Janthinobacterium sp. UMAB-60 TaxID=1365365 RepID=UPI001C576F28|nr:DNA methyltransferase [Janthinobacterium sp. UMAB-60]
MTTLSKQLRTQLENTVKAARDVAEEAAQAALAQLAVGDARGPDYQSELQKVLRRRLRAHGRALGDMKLSDDTQNIQHLVWEVAYEHWHRMLFARFLAENGLLMWEPGAAVSLDDCRDMVDNYPDMAMNAKTQWELAGKLAARMLPQVFKPNSPVFELSFAPEYQRALEKMLAALPREAFKASDSLGWVYQFWQSKRKDEVNASEVKIGADELPAVTQLFTEPYMVEFLLHNSLGAWWQTRHPGKPCPVELTYLRTLDDGTPAAGTFEGWPATLAEFKLLDPCCGSGHFLVAAFLLLVPMRMASEGLNAMDAVDSVLQDNLHGLEIDPRCVEIAVFALALTAWNFHDEDGNALGVRADMPLPNIACCGLKVAGRVQDWEALVTDDDIDAEHLRQGLSRLHETFTQAPLLGSLLDPSKANKGDLFAADYSILRDLLKQALATEHQPALFDEIEGRWDLALSAQGLLEAARLLDQRYHFVITNVPYLTRGKQTQALKDFCQQHYSDAKNDLANVFLERCHELALKDTGVVQVVMPQNWLFLTSYKRQRESLLKRTSWNFLARLGSGAFETISGEVVNIILLTQVNSPPDSSFNLCGIDASEQRTVNDKVEWLHSGIVISTSQKSQLTNPDSTISLQPLTGGNRLSEFASSYKGVGTGDDNRYKKVFWEVALSSNWIPMASAPDCISSTTGGYSSVLFWQQGAGELSSSSSAYLRNIDKWSHVGILFGMMSDLPCARYAGGAWDTSSCVLIPNKVEYLPSIWAYAESPQFRQELRSLVTKISVEVNHFTQVPFDISHWQKVAAERYPNGLPKPYSDDPTQWIFHGHPQPSDDPLQVAVARLLGYTWPAELGEEMELSEEARAWVAKCQSLDSHVDDDGIVCLSPVRGEKAADERLLALLIDSWETVVPGSWKASVLDKLLADADCSGKGVDVWLREKFFEQHARRFQHRPFIWHVWDGLKDGFGALVNYHLLDAKKLERLIHTYLGDWIRNQEAGVASGVDGAELRLAAAKQLKTKLEAILEGEAPYDIFVRWKSMQQQSIGWNPDLNDGVRMNIRPFMTAEVLRHNKKPKLNITWDKDRGKDVVSAPWFHKFDGDRINDHHLSQAEKLISKLP